MHRPHRAGRGPATTGHRGILRGAGHPGPEGRRRLRRRRQEQPNRAERRGWRGDARHRGGRGGRSRCRDRRLLRPEHGPRLPRRRDGRDPRHREPAVGHLHQLGRSRVPLDRPGDAGDGPGVPGRRPGGPHGAVRGRGQRLGRRGHRRSGPRGLPGVQPTRRRLWRDAADRVARHDQRGADVERRAGRRRDGRRDQRRLRPPDLPGRRRGARVGEPGWPGRAGRARPRR